MNAPAKPKYRTTNWKEYNAALKARGSLLVWLDHDICWHGSASGKRGRSPKVHLGIDASTITKLRTPAGSVQRGGAVALSV